MTFRSLAISIGAAALAATTPAQATTLIPAVFNFTSNNSNINNGVVDGNARQYFATSPDVGPFNLRVTAWSLETVNGVTYVRDSKLMVYSGGLGIISGDDGTGSNNRHTIDNHTRKDFLILQFDRNVQLTSATFNTYGINGGTRDSDAEIKYGWMSGGLDWNDSLQFLNNENVSALNALFAGNHTSNGPAGSNSTRNPDPGRHNGDIWVIGAAFNNPDSKFDGFKLASLSVIPEPGTWALLIMGFGLVGGAIRRRADRATAIA